MTVTTASPALDSASSAPLPATLRIVLAGGSGHLGRILEQHLSRRGHRVVTLTRNPHFKRNTFNFGGRVALWDGRSPGDWQGELDGADVLLNLSGRSVDCRYNRKNRREILESRVASTAVLGKVIQTVRRPPRVWLNASTATIYRDSCDQDMDEASELGGHEQGVPASWGFSIEVARRWEETLFAADTPQTRKVALRTAMVMSSEPGGVFNRLANLTRMGLGGHWGNGRQWMSWVHELDFCRAIEFLIGQESIAGIVNIAAPAPLPNEQFLAALRDAWGIGFGLPSTNMLLSIGAFLLRTETELLLKSRRVVPRRLLENGFCFLFPDWPEAARDLAQSWRARRQSMERRVA